MAFVALHKDDNFYSFIVLFWTDDAWMKNKHVW